MKPMLAIMALLSIFCAWFLQGCGGNKGYQVIVEFPEPVADSKVKTQTLFIYSIIAGTDDATCGNLISGSYKPGDEGYQPENIPNPFTKKVSPLQIAKKDTRTYLFFVEGEDYNNQPILRGCEEVEPGSAHNITVKLGMVCPAGWGDCDGDFSTGCEADFTSPSVCNGHATDCSFTDGAMTCVCSPVYTGANCDKCAVGSLGTYPNCSQCVKEYLGIFPNCFLPSSLDYCLTSQCFPVAPTGQTFCYDTGGNNITCPVGGSGSCDDGSGNIVPLCGQDAQYAKTRSFTCYNAGGNVQTPCAANASDNEVVSDSATGLIWQRKFVSDINQADSKNACGAVYAGDNDWRVPNPIELNSIVDYGQINPAINSAVFPGTTADWFCSSSDFSTPGEVYGVNFANGVVSHLPDTATLCSIRCVRGGPMPTETGADVRFSPPSGSEPVVTDLVTGLMWEQNYISKPCQTCATPPCYWQEALTCCESLDYGGFKDWRLPNIDELVSLVNYKLPGNPSSDFPGMPPQTFWSSSTSTDKNSQSWDVHFLQGITSYIGKTTTQYFVLCVRNVP